MNLNKRVDYIKELIQIYKTKTANIRRFWIPGFFNQKNFLSTLMIIVSRQENISMERLHITYRIMKERESEHPMLFNNKRKSKTFYINGLWLYGAKWNSQQGTIEDLSPNDLTGNEMPTL